MTDAQAYLCRLADDIREGQRLATEAANQDDGEDGGTCNMDGVFIRIPRVNEATVRAVVGAAGIHIGHRMKLNYFGTGYMLNAEGGGQADRRDRATTALYNHLKAKGHDVSHFQQMD